MCSQLTHIYCRSTIVLTTPLGNFVDVRVLRPISPASTGVTSPSNLEWAFAGTSSSTSTTNTKPAHTVWKHWVDSQCPNADVKEVIDEGDMFSQENGEVLESGRMINPASGRDEAYEECWADVDLPEGDNTGWVVRLQGEGDRTRGIVVRVGRWMQGVLKNDDECSVGRWRYDSSDKVANSRTWDVLVMIRNLELPEKLFGQGRLDLGEKMVGKNGVWECIESWDGR